MGNTGGKSKKGYQHVHNQVKYQRQKLRTLENKIKAWKRYLIDNPNDEQNKTALNKLLQNAKGGGR